MHSKQTNRRRWGVAAACVVLIVGLPSLWVRVELRRQRLDRQLVVAIKNQDEPRILALLQQGANATTCEQDARPLKPLTMARQFFNMELHHRPARSISDPAHAESLSLYYYTALQNKNHYIGPGVQHDPQESVALAMLNGGAAKTQRCDGCTPLYGAVFFHHHEMVRRLMEVDANVNPKYPFFGTTSLMNADAADTRVLLDHGAKLEAKDGFKRTALYYADGAKSTVLLDAGAQINTVDCQGWTPLMAACVYRRDSAVSAMLEHRADVSQKDKAGDTALVYASYVCGLEAVKALTRAGAQINVADSQGYTPPMLSLRNKDIRVFEWLAAHGADVNARDKKGLSVLDKAKQERYELLTSDEPYARYDSMIRQLQARVAR